MVTVHKLFRLMSVYVSPLNCRFSLAHKTAQASKKGKKAASKTKLVEKIAESAELRATEDGQEEGDRPEGEELMETNS